MYNEPVKPVTYGPANATRKTDEVTWSQQQQKPVSNPIVQKQPYSALKSRKPQRLTWLILNLFYL
jgi:hypothetical protein